MEDLNFKTGIKKKLPDNVLISRRGLDLLNIIINAINSRLVNFCLETDVSITTAQHAIESLFKNQLKNLALAEGGRVLMLHANGFLKYEPERLETQIHKNRKKGKKAKIIAAQEFSEGISALTSLSFNDEASLQIPSKTILCELLEELAVKISDRVQSKRKNNISQDDIIDAINQLLPEELARHARAEGARMMFLHQNGMLDHGRKTAEKTDTPKMTRKRKRSTSYSRRRETEAPKKTRKSKRSLPSSKRRETETPKKTSKRKRSLPSSKRRETETPKKTRKRKHSLPSSKRRKTETPKKTHKRKHSESSSRRRKSTTRKSPIGVTKTVHKISKQQPMKKKKVSKQVITREIPAAVTTDIITGIKKLNKIYKQDLSAEGDRLIVQCLHNLLNELYDEIRKSNSSLIGPADVRRAVIKLYPPELADLAIAHLSRVLMI